MFKKRRLKRKAQKAERSKLNSKQSIKPSYEASLGPKTKVYLNQLQAEVPKNKKSSTETVIETLTTAYLDPIEINQPESLSESTNDKLEQVSVSMKETDGKKKKAIAKANLLKKD